MPNAIRQKVDTFGESYNEVVQEIIRDSVQLDPDGEIFIQCAARILSKFKMTRSGPFQGLRFDEGAI